MGIRPQPKPAPTPTIYPADTVYPEAPPGPQIHPPKPGENSNPFPPTKPPSTSAPTVQPVSMNPTTGGTPSDVAIDLFNTNITPPTAPPGAPPTKLTPSQANAPAAATASTAQMPAVNRNLTDPMAGVNVPTTTATAAQGVGPTSVPELTDLTKNLMGEQAPQNLGPGAKTADLTKEQTVKGQLEDLLSDGSPVLEAARERARRQAAARGALNSSMATEEGTAALLGEATKIAGTDAQIAAQRAEFNANAENQFRMAEKTFLQNWALGDQKYRQQIGLNEEAFQHNVALSDQNFRQQASLDEARANNEIKLSTQNFLQQLQTMWKGAAFDMDKMQMDSTLKWAQNERAFAMDIEKNNIQNAFTWAQNERTFAQGMEKDQQSQLAAYEMQERSNVLQLTRDEFNAENEFKRLVANHQLTLEQIQYQGNVNTAIASQEQMHRIQLQYMSDIGGIQRSAMEQIAQVMGNTNLTAAQQVAARDAINRDTNQRIAVQQAIYASMGYWVAPIPQPGSDTQVGTIGGAQPGNTGVVPPGSGTPTTPTTPPVNPPRGGGGGGGGGVNPPSGGGGGGGGLGGGFGGGLPGGLFPTPTQPLPGDNNYPVNMPKTGPQKSGAQVQPSIQPYSTFGGNTSPLS